MRAVRVPKFGGPDVLETVENLPQPVAGVEEVLIRTQVAGVNYIDTYHRTGAYPMDCPFTLGIEGGGVIEKIGSNVTDISVGDRVTYCGVPGSYAEWIVVPAQQVVSVPENMDILVATAAMVQGLTAHYLCRSSYQLDDNSSVLIHAGAGGVGRLAIQIAHLLGATVFTTVSNPTKMEIARQAGAQHVINYIEEDFVDYINSHTSGKGVDVVLDSVGKTTFHDSLRCLRPRGFLCLFGQSSGAVGPIDPQILNEAGSVFLTRPTLTHYALTREELLRRSAELHKWMDEDQLSIRIDRTLSLSQAAEAHQALEARETMGKVLLLTE